MAGDAYGRDIPGDPSLSLGMDIHSGVFSAVVGAKERGVYAASAWRNPVTIGCCPDTGPVRK